MTKLLFIITFIALLVNTAKATHIVGGELNYLYLGNNDYQITLTVYRDCVNGNPAAIFSDSIASIGIFNMNNILIQSLIMRHSIPDTLPNLINSPCVIPPTNVCYDVVTYVDTINLPPISGGYQIAYQRCCRNMTILNIINPLATGATYYATIPDTSIEVINSNPIFNNWPPPFICSSLPFSFDHSASDPDGDSLYYELFQPFHGANQTVPMPQPPNNPPYPLVLWNAPYNTLDMLGGSIPLSIDPNTGLLTATPGPLGQFVVGMKVSEYRNGVFLSETKRDFQFNVVPCVNITVAALVAPNFSCESFTASFVNNSSGAGTYLWDFGDGTTTSDTSSLFTPSYTYPDTGTYTVTLIAFSVLNPACNDTAYGTVTILPEFIQNMNFTNEPCTQDIIFNSNTSLDSTGNVIFDWNFGNGLGNSNNQNPSYTYPDTGTYTVTLISYSPQNPGCNDTGTVTVTVFPEFILSSSLTDIPCSADVSFFGNSSFDGLYPVNYFWDFGVSSVLTDTSNLSNPNYSYLSPGTYNPILIAYTDSPACGDTTQLQITIYPNFSLSHNIQNIKCSYGVEFVASSSLDEIVVTNYSWDFGDGNTSTSSSENHTYPGRGSYNVSLSITTANGCTDSYTTTIEKLALAEVFVPNAFTPNGDRENDVLFVRGGIDEISFKIYNRWGELIFETNDQSIGWDGTYNGSPVDPGVFVYHLTTKCITPSAITEENIVNETFKKGNITVIR
ncbi:MAG: PKD domain-containing protein [Flavobacteriales bacterium]|nr:PKD domain-containing protein [Flavobacteriales bacterium]